VAIVNLSNSNNDVTTGALATLVLTPATAIAASNLVVIAVVFSDATSSVASIAANTTAGTWSRVGSYPVRGAGSAAVTLDLWWGTGAVGTTLTVTAGAAVNYWCAFATALSGASTAIFRTNNNTVTNAGTSYTARSGTATPTEAGDYGLLYYADAASAIATLALNSTISPGYTQGFIETAAVNSSMGYALLTGTTAQEAGWDVTGAPANTASVAAVLLVQPVATAGAQALVGSGVSASRASASLTQTAAPAHPLTGTAASTTRASAALTQTVAGAGTTYYVAAAGNDALAGTSPATAWATVDKLNNYALNPGDSVLFNRGDTFTVTTAGGVNSNYGGTAGKPITWGAYGTGAQPIISGGATFTGGWATTGTANVYSKAQASYVGGLLYGGVWALANRNNGGTGTIATLAAMNSPSWWWSAGTLYVHTPDTLAVANTKAVIVNNQADLLNIDVSSATNKGPVTIQGLEFRHSSDATLYLNGFTGRVTVSGCTFKYCGWGTSETTGQGAIAYISNSTGGGRVTACTFDSIEATPMYAVGAPRVDFDNNTVTNITGSWIQGGANCVEYETGATGGNVYNNTLTMGNIGPSAVTNQSPKGAITYAGSGSAATSLPSACYGNTTNGGAWGISASNCNIDVHDNLCQNHTGTAEINYAAGLYFGPGFASVPTVDNVRLYRNRVVNCRYSVYLAGDAGVVYTGLLVAHNTFANTSAQQGNIYAALPVAGTFENNIYHGPSDTSYLIALAAGVTSGKTLTQDYELVGANRAAGFNLNGTTYATLATYLAATNAASTHGVVGNPLFVAAPGNLTLGSGSPAIDAGMVIAGINDGTAGSTRYLGAAPDLGYAEAAASQAFIGGAASGTKGGAALTQVPAPAVALVGAGASATGGGATLTRPPLAYLRGVNLAGLDFAPTTLPGTVGQSFFPPTAAEFDYCKSKGLTLIRVPFLWERVQPTLGGALDGTYLGYLDAAVANAASRGMTVVLDVHNYGGYSVAGVVHTIGAADGVVTQTHFTDLWTKLAARFKGQPVWYGLMNEPHDFVAGAYTPNLIIHDFETGVQGVNEEGGAVVTASTAAHTGTGSAQVAGIYGTGYSQVRIRAALPAAANYSSNGNTISVWVYVPAGFTTLQAYVGYFDGAYTNFSGPTVNLNAGAWNQVTYTINPTLPTVVNDLVLQVWGTGVNATVNLRVDDWTVGSGVGGQQLWTNAAQAAITAIRATGATERIAAGGYAYSGAAAWQTNNTNFLLTDSGNNLIYEAHQYFDRDGSGTYVNPAGSTTPSTYAIELNGVVDPVNSGARSLKYFTDWCAAHGVQGYIGEMGWPYDAADAASWNALANAAYAQLDSVGFPVTYWANGPSWGTYRLSAEPAGLGTGTVTDAAQMAAIAAHPTTATLSGITGAARTNTSASAALMQSTAGAMQYSGSASTSTGASTTVVQIPAAAHPLTGNGASTSNGAAPLTQTVATGATALVGNGASGTAGSAPITQTGAASIAFNGAGISGTSGSATLTQATASALTLVGGAASASGATASLTQSGAGAVAYTGSASSATTGNAALTQATVGSNAFVGAASSGTGGTASLTQTAVGALAFVGAAMSGTAAAAPLTQTGVTGSNVLTGNGASATGGSATLAQSPAPALLLTGGATSTTTATGTLSQAAVGVNTFVGSGASASGASAGFTQTTAPALTLSGSATSGTTGAAPLTQAAAGALALTGSGASVSSGAATLTQTVSGLALFGGAASGSSASGSLTQTPATGTNALTGSAASGSGSSVVLTLAPPPMLVLVGMGASLTQGAAILSQSNTALLALVGRAASGTTGIAALTISAMSPTIPARVLTSDETRAIVTTTDEVRTLVTIGDAV